MKQFDFPEVEYIDDDETDEKFQLYIPKSCLSAGQILNILRRMLKYVNRSYMDLAEHTAFCAIKIYDYGILHNKLNHNINRNKLILLSVLFTIGAYKDDILEDKNNVTGIFLYTYLFLKHLTPLKDLAKAVLFYKFDYKKAKALEPECAEYASLLFTAMRICIKLRQHNYNYNFNYNDNRNYNSEIFTPEFIDNCHQLYNREYLDLFFLANEKGDITNNLQNLNYFYCLDDYCNTVMLSYRKSFMLLKLLIYSVDFISTSTVTHIINTAFHATEISSLMNLRDLEIDEVFTASVIHDIGKMAVDVKILESAGTLTEKEIEIMHSHIQKGIDICRGIVGDKISDIAFRHHEALDGSGYPFKLTDKDLTPQQKILAIGDVFSALTDARTYKPSFPKEKTCEILNEFVQNKKLDPAIVDVVIQNYDSIQAHTQMRRPMLTTNLGNVMIEYFLLQDCKSVSEVLKMLSNM